MYEETRPNLPLLRLLRANAERAGLTAVDPPNERRGAASSDFGNVSQVMPSAIVSFAVSEQPVPGHSHAMREAAITDLAHANAIATAKTLALTALDLLANSAMLDTVREDFVARGPAAR
jgi:metal-dependent amidase/aminoacylase/carboxypeptidase family protein